MFEYATDENKLKAQKLVLAIEVSGSTNIFDALKQALELFNSTR